MATLGKRVRQYREDRGYSLSELAKQSGVSRSYLYQVESGASSPTEEKLLALASALGVTITDLLGVDAMPVSIPDALATFAKQANLPSGDVDMLTHINFRGKQPTTPEGWRALYLMIKATSEEM